ncbi:hypothetical protein HZU75_15780 [Chitinibacter fontanus]|uniref:Transporter substrate-binding domain-containing protein n=1 Tax=Chitinibacter fontanus TaxID=1737446 RepID=A0A7D5VCF4_9NEIS|nr:hypothetical protein [Chitinibacter fontanus]QLI82860.1 hypothetical protein HZU75_15780 [Chitinibacter fontanus]
MKLINGLILAMMAPMTFATVLLAVPRDVILDYQKLLRNRDIMEIRDYTGLGARRDTVELIVFQQALLRGGLDEPVRLVPVDSYARILVEVEAGNVTASGTSVWASDAAQTKALLSAPLIRDGEYVAGFYAEESNSRVRSASLKELRAMTAVTNRAWKNDVATLESLGIAKLESAPTFGMIAKMLKGERGDFTLASFKSTPDMSFEVEGVRLVPIKGMKVAMPGSRHFLISPNSQGSQLLEALNKGLGRMRKDGTIRKAYIDAGFFNARVESWLVVNPSQIIDR